MGNSDNNQPPQKSFGESRNLHVTEHYVKNWIIFNALREFFQNFRDALVKTSGAERNLQFLPGFEHPDHGYFSWAVEYFDVTIKQNRILGEIVFDLQNKQLTFSNSVADESVTLSRMCLLMGGSQQQKSSDQAHPEIAGKFGEGMKLAVLTLLRQGLGARIECQDDRWEFSLNPDQFYDPTEKCLTVTFSRRDPPILDFRNKNFVRVTVSNLEFAEFKDFRSKMLQLNPMTIQRIRIDGMGELLLSKHLIGKLFVKSIYVCDKPFGIQHYKFGFNMFNMEINRDRNIPVDHGDFLNKISLLACKILAELKNRNQQPQNQPQANVAKIFYSENIANLDQPYFYDFFLDQIWNSINWGEFTSVHHYASQEEFKFIANDLFDKFRSKWTRTPNVPESQEPGKYGPESIKLVQPGSSLNEHEFDLVLASKIPFFKIATMDHWQWYALSRATKYETPKDWLRKHVEERQIVNFADNTSQKKALTDKILGAVISTQYSGSISNIVIKNLEFRFACLREKVLTIDQKLWDNQSNSLIELLHPASDDPPEKIEEKARLMTLILALKNCRNEGYFLSL